MNKLSTWILLASLSIPIGAREGCNAIQDEVLDRMEKLHIEWVDWVKIIWCARSLGIFYNKRIAPYMWAVDTKWTIAVCLAKEDKMSCSSIWNTTKEWQEEFEKIYMNKVKRLTI